MTSKSVFFTLVLGLTFAGCQSFRKSATWETVANTKIDTKEAADPSHAYAQGLHDVLVGRGVEHKIVTYRFHSGNRTHDEAMAKRNAVIYRDDTYPQNPWWLTDERIGRPVSLLNGDLDQQMRSHLRRDVEIVSWEEYSSSDGNTMTRTEWKPAAL